MCSQDISGRESGKLLKFCWMVAFFSAGVLTLGLVCNGWVGFGWGSAVVVFWAWLYGRRIVARPELIDRVACLTVIAATCVFMLIPVRSLSTAVDRPPTCANTMKFIGLALHNYHDVYGTFPPPRIADEKGTGFHSWRVLLLPFLDGIGPSVQYDFSEPWDGPRNIKLANSRNPYICPKCGHGSFTSYVAVTGSRTAWPQSGRSLNAIPDGASTTILVLENNSSDILWTEPRDLTLDDAVRKLSTMNTLDSHCHGSGKRHFTNIVLCDATVEMLHLPVDREEAGAIFVVDDNKGFPNSATEEGFASGSSS